MKDFLTNAGVDYIFKEPECYPLFDSDFTIGEWMKVNALTAPVSRSEHMEDFLSMSGDITKPLSKEKYINFIQEGSLCESDRPKLNVSEPLNSDFRVLIEDGFIARMVFSYEASVKFGRRSRWCVSDKSTKKYYNSYSSRVDIVMIESPLECPLDKIGMLLFEGGSLCLFDKKGCIINDGKIYDINMNVIFENRIEEIEDILSPELMDSIYNDYSLHN